MKQFVLAILLSILSLPVFTQSICTPQQLSGPDPVFTKLTPDTGRACNFFNGNFSFYFPTTVQGNPLITSLIQYKIDSVSGLPSGVVYQTNKQTPYVGGEIGCIGFSGTPLQVGIFVLKLNFSVTLQTSTPMVTLVQNMVYSDTLFVSNGCIQRTVTNACLPTVVSYSTPFSFDSTQWSFTGGVPSQSNSSTVNGVVFNSPGQKIVSLIAKKNIASVPLTLVSISANVTGNFWCGDVEEPSLPVVGCVNPPDIYFILSDGFKIDTSHVINDSLNPKFLNLNYQVNQGNLSFRFFDFDSISVHDDGGFVTANITTAGIYTFSTSTGNVSFTATFTGGNTVETFIFYDTINVTYCFPVWNGTGNWSTNLSNWNINALPQATDSVIIQSGTVTVSTNQTTEELVIESGANVHITNGAILTVNGNYYNNGGNINCTNGGQVVFKKEGYGINNQKRFTLNSNSVQVGGGLRLN